MATATKRDNPGVWRKEKLNPNATKRRWWDLGAWINNRGNLEIYRGAETKYLKQSDNKCLVLRQGDTETNPPALEVINEGSGHFVTFLNQNHGTGPTPITSFIANSGSLTVSSSAELKEDFAELEDGTVEEHLESLNPRSYTLKRNGERDFGLTAENFAATTGYGDGKFIPTNTLLGLLVRYVVYLYKRSKDDRTLIASLTERVNALEKE